MPLDNPLENSLPKSIGYRPEGRVSKPNPYPKTPFPKDMDEIGPHGSLLTPEEDEETAKEIKAAHLLIGHLDEPCVAPNVENIREFYIQEAQRLLTEFKSAIARKLIERALRPYVTK